MKQTLVVGMSSERCWFPKKVLTPDWSSTVSTVLHSYTKTLQGFLLAIAVQGFCGYMVVDTVP